MDLALALREKRAPETAPVPLRRDAGSRRARSVDLERPDQIGRAGKGQVRRDADGTIAKSRGCRTIPNGCTKVTTAFWGDLTGARQAAEAELPKPK
jgi:hypothetical protein